MKYIDTIELLRKYVKIFAWTTILTLQFVLLYAITGDIIYGSKGLYSYFHAQDKAEDLAQNLYLTQKTQLHMQNKLFSLKENKDLRENLSREYIGITKQNELILHRTQ